MARLHEYQGKAILAENGFKIPRGRAASTADEAVAVAKELLDQKGSEVVVKIQAWTTGRAGIGGVAFAKKPDEARGHAARMLEMKVGQFPVEAVLVEEKIAIDREFFLSFAIDDATRAPTIIFAPGGGTGIEERAASTRRIACDVIRGPEDSIVAEAIASCGLSSTQATQLADSIRKLFAAARKVEARSLEINPLVLTKDGQFVVADCRITIDDYAVVRHPELKIEIAREFDHPPTPLEGAAYGLAKAFWELDLNIPAVIRLGGNTEDRAVDVLQRMSRLLRAPIEGYRKTDAPAMIATRFAELVATGKGTKWKPRAPRLPKFVKDPSVTTIPVKGGRVRIDSAQWSQIRGAVETHSGGLIVDRAGAPVSSVPGEEFATRSEEH